MQTTTPPPKEHRSHYATCSGYYALIDFTTKGIMKIYTNFDNSHIIKDVLSVENVVEIPQNYHENKYLFTCSATSDDTFVWAALNIHTKLNRSLFELASPENDKNAPQIIAGATILTPNKVIHNVTDVIIYHKLNHLYIYSNGAAVNPEIFTCKESVNMYHVETDLNHATRHVQQNGENYFIGIFDARNIIDIKQPQGTK